jgi:hypothetical protein
VRLDYASVLEAGDGNAEDATALLLVAAVHGATSHQFDRLQHVVDVLLLARGGAGAVNLDRLRHVARRCHAGFAIAAALAIAGRVFQEPRCWSLASSLGARVRTILASRLISPRVILCAQTSGRSADSWRRKALRELLRTGVQVPPAV